MPAERSQAGQRSNATSWYQSCTGLAASLAWCQDDLTVSFEQQIMWRPQEVDRQNN
ncbi:hypothetical protein FG05_35281 [Fusarium graminearum]|nr:hypothetical protein FG05_35281 [Fusarium graminearum]